MATNKYALDTANYGVLNWDAQLADAMEDIDKFIHTYLSGASDDLLYAGEALALGEAVYIHTDGTMKKAKADAAATMPCLGIAAEAISNGVQGRVQRVGPLTNASWTWTIGGKVYVSAATAGALTQTKPATNAQCVGVALSATILFVLIGDPITDRATRIASPTANQILKEDANGDLAAAAKLNEDANGNLVQANTGSAPGSGTADGYYQYSDDQVAGNACPHFLTEAGQLIRLYEEASADQADVSAPAAFNSTDGEIGGLTISDPPTQAEVQALRDKCEELADDCRALQVTVGTYKTLLSEIRRVMLKTTGLGFLKGGA